MPVYIYFCKSCDILFEESKPMSKSAVIPKCEKCNKKENVSRSWANEKPLMFQDIKTVGSLAHRNESRLSDDEKSSIRKRNDEKMERKIHGKPNWSIKNE